MTLSLADVSKYEAGNYTCYANDIGMLQAKVEIIEQAELITKGKN